MKLIWYSLAALVLLPACTGSGSLNEEKAKKLIIDHYHFPRVFDYTISCGDPMTAKKMLAANLEEKGWVHIRKSGETFEGDGWVSFTEKAKPYLLPTPDEERKRNGQKVKMADEDIDRIDNLTLSDNGKFAMMTYYVKRTDISPFTVVLSGPMKEEIMKRAYFTKTEKGWMVDPKAELNFYMRQ